MHKLIAALLAAAAAAGTAQAGPIATAPHAYLGVGAATVEYLAGGGKVNPKLFAGYAFGDTVAVEAGYVDFSKRGFTRTRGAETVNVTHGGYGMYLAVRHTRPLTENLSATGKLGISHSQRKYDNSLGMHYKDVDTGAYGAFGLQYAVTRKVALSAEYERYGKDKRSGAKADAWTLGVNYAF